MSKITDDKLSKSRRAFFKKVAYTAPAVIALGSLVKPVSASAAASTTQLKTGGSGGNQAEKDGFGSIFG